MPRYDYFVRWGVIALLAICSASASAEPVEWSAFFGANKLPKDLALGGSVDPEQRPQTGPMLGGHITWLPLASHWISAGVDGQLSLTTTWTGYGFTSRRQSYFAPVLGYRAAAIVRLFPLAQVEPHLLAGGGGASTASYSPYMSSDTAGVYFWGAGVTVRLGSWNVRIDGQQVWVPVMSGDHAASYELQIGIGRYIASTLPTIEVPPNPPDDVGPNPTPPLALGPVPAPAPVPAPVAVPAPAPVPAPVPTPVPTPHPAPTPTPLPAPTPPPVPTPAPTPAGSPAAAAAFETASGVRFETGKARITAAGKLSLAKTIKVLREHNDLKITITGHDADAALAKKRAEAVKWYLIDQGIAEDQVDTATGEASKKPISITVRP